MAYSCGRFYRTRTGMLTRTSVTIQMPVLTDSGVTVRVIMGELGGATSPAQVYSPLVGIEADLAAGANTRLPLHSDWEYAALGLSGTVEVDGLALSTGPLLYLALVGPTGRCGQIKGAECC